MIKIHKNFQQYWYTVVAKNGKTLVHSETFKTKASCHKSIHSLLSIMDQGVKIIDETK